MGCATILSWIFQDFTVDFYLRQYWTDERLKFQADDKDQKLTLTSEIWKEIWIPSTYFIGSKKAYFHDVTTDNYLLQIGQNGSIFFSMRYICSIFFSMSNGVSWLHAQLQIITFPKHY
jgi:hypothetical protein